MNIQRVRVCEPVVTAVAVCFVACAQWFILRYTVHWQDDTGVSHRQTFRTPLTRKELIEQSGGPELVDLLVAHPGRWWTMPMPTRAEEEYAP